MTPRNMLPRLAFFEHVRREGSRIWRRRMYGVQVPGERRRIYRWLDNVNRFAEQPENVPPGFVRLRRRPSADWIRRFMLDPHRQRIEAGAVPREPGQRTYWIHDNGGRPFVAYVSRQSVRVYRKPTDRYMWEEDWARPLEERRAFYTEPVARIESPRRVWTTSVAHPVRECPQPRGNTLLVEERPHQYVHIGSQIYRFTTDEPIRHFFSPLIGADVPYPVAVSATRFYFLGDQVSVLRSELPIPRAEWADAYQYFFGHRVLDGGPALDRQHPATVRHHEQRFRRHPLEHLEILASSDD